MAVAVVIPAHDEAAVIGRLLEMLAAKAGQGQLRVIVVCNGCTDATAAVARSVAPWAQVLEIPTASKTDALDAGDSAAGETFPRFYVDADVRISGEALFMIERRLGEDGLLAVAPTVRYDTSQSSAVVRSHVRVLELLAPHASGIHGTGVMGVSEAGRRRFTTWPSVVADDYYLDGLFTASEKTRVKGVEVAVTVSQGLPDLIRRRSRVRRANEQLHRSGLRMTRPPARRLVDVVRSKPSVLPDAAVFVLVAMLTRLHQRMVGARDAPSFTRDNSR